ncbi:ATP-binding protein [Streptomyces sp. NPDC045470]|uniref:ATP-binding protein n=1 Tax=Streptomyces sp. NPDC045470 TaxID=3155469 RepID=UPI0034018A3E
MSLLRPAPVTHHFPRNRRSPGRARAAYREWAAAQELGPATVETGELILGELTVNAVPAASGPGRWNEVRFALDQAALRVEVSDAGGRRPGRPGAEAARRARPGHGDRQHARGRAGRDRQAGAG